MLYREFLALLATIIGFVGSIFLIKSIILLKPEQIHNLLTSHSFASFSYNQVDSYAKQKADAISGFVLILLASLIQIIALVIFKKYTFLTSKKSNGILISFVIAIPIICIFFLINKLLYRHNKIEINKLAVKDKCEKRISNSMKSSDFGFIEQFAASVLNIKKIPSESRYDYLKKLSDYISWNIPDEIDINIINNL